MKVSKRYPVVNGDIDRTWLVSQLSRAKRPNALLELALAPIPIIRIAAQTWVHVDTLIDFVLGDDDLTPFELHCLSRATDYLSAGNDEEYLEEEVLSMWNDEPIDVKELDGLPEDPATALIRKFIALPVVSSGAHFAACLRLDMKNFGVCIPHTLQPRSTRITRRRRQQMAAGKGGRKHD